MAGSVPAVAGRELPPPSPLDGPDTANKRAGWKKYPMVMRHPAEKPAVVSNDRTVDANGREVWVNAPPGQAIKFGPVTVLNEHQEELHLAKGYRGHGDPVAIARHELAPLPPGYRYDEYPRILEDGSIDEGPDAPPEPDNFYPYYVRTEGWEPERVENREEHQALLKKRGVEEPPPPAPEADPRDVRIASLEDQLAEIKALLLAQVRGGLVGQPAQVPPAAGAAEAGISEASSEPPDQVEAASVDLQVNTAEAAAAQVSDEPVATVDANLHADPQIAGGEPSAEDAIKARIAELDAEEAALEPTAEEPAETPAKQRKR